MSAVVHQIARQNQRVVESFSPIVFEFETTYEDWGERHLVPVRMAQRFVSLSRSRLSTLLSGLETGDVVGTLCDLDQTATHLTALAEVIRIARERIALVIEAERGSHV